MPLKDRKAAQAAAKKSWLSRDLPNWRSQVDDLLKGKQIIVNGRREWNSIYVAAKRKWVRALCVKISDSQFASFPISSTIKCHPARHSTFAFTRVSLSVSND